MERLKHMKETLIGCIQAQLGDIHNADTHELGEAIDMIKDLEEAMYYCTIIKAMEKAEEEDKKRVEHHYYTPYYLPDRDMDRNDLGRMYYPRSRDSQGRFTSGRSNYNGEPSMDNSFASGHVNGDYQEREFPLEMRDQREGRSPMSRRTYMESKELHKDKAVKIKDLEKYMKELSEDLVEMIEDTSPEEKQLLEKKITALASKVASLNNG